MTRSTSSLAKAGQASTNLRLLAARVINDVTDGCSLSDCLERVLTSIPESRDRAFLQALCYGVCRFYVRLDIILSHLLQKPMKAKDSDVHALLLVGLYQLSAMRIPDYAAVTETVNATQALKKSWAKGFVNAVLREYLRQKERIDAQIKEEQEAEYAHPHWLISAIKKAWPNAWQDILIANNMHPPLALRVNQRLNTRENYLAKLIAQAISADIIAETSQGIMLASPLAVEALPGFAQGEVSVQDGAAQLAAELLELTPDLRVLDACAAPGGKLTHIAEIEPSTTLTAIDHDAQRLSAIKENLARLKISNASLICHDVGDVSTWWDGQLFDRILLDAPCSASGVIRRHPDIKLLRLPTDIKKLAKQQLHLLTSLWPLLKPNGLLVYATCSIFPQENTEVIQEFLASHSDASDKKIVAQWGVSCAVGRQILPGQHNLDGFYYARLLKKSI